MNTGYVLSSQPKGTLYDVQVKGLINEAHFVPDCNLAFPVWSVEACPVLPLIHACTPGGPAGNQCGKEHSWGYVLANSLWEEVLLAVNQRGLKPS